MKVKKPIPHWPYPFYFWVVFILVLSGIADSIYLLISHYRNYVDIGYQSFCAISKALNCDTVSQSPYAIFLNVPVAVWGIVGYCFLAFLLLAGHIKTGIKRRLWPAVLVTSLVYTLFSLVLAGISSYKIHSYCIMCIYTYAVNIAVLYYAWLIRRRFDPTSLWTGIRADVDMIRRHWRRFAAGGAGFALLIGALPFFFPQYWHLKPPELESTVSSGFTEDGHPWIGAENPVLTIEEFTDYQCFQCRKMHFHLRRLISMYPDRIRLVHHHYPMDHKFNPLLVKEPFHESAGQMALLAIAAADLDRFWPANDFLYSKAAEKRSFTLRAFAEAIEVTPKKLLAARNKPETFRKLTADIRLGLKLGITGTPTFRVGEQLYDATLPPELLKQAETASGH